MNPIKSKPNYSGYLTSLQSENTVRKIPQPVKIAQLFGSSGHLQNGQRNSSIKISLPERITPYLKKAPSQKKNVTNTCIKLPHNERNARRNLKFTETLNSVTKIKKCAEAGTNDENNYPKRKNLDLSTRRSFLLPPNTIKELHIKNKFKQNKFEVSQFRILTVSSENTNPRLSETSKSCSPPLANISAHVDSVVNAKKNKTSLIQSISSQTFNVNEQSGINILHSSYSDLADTGDSAVEKIPENLNSNKISNVNICESQNNDCDIIINRSHLSSASDTNVRIDADLHNDDDDVDQNDICCAERHSRSYATCVLQPNAETVKEARGFLFKRVDRERSSSTTTNIYEENFYSSLQTVKMISESCLNLQRSTNEDERATLSKTELTVLGSKLNRLVCRLEEDMSDLKLTLTTVTKLLSATNMANEEIKDNNETKITQQIIEITENPNDNVKAMDNIDTKLPCITIIDTEPDNTLKETHKMLDINRSHFLETNGKDNPEMQLSDQMYFASGSDKENKEIPNSPIVNQCKKLENSNAANDSFVNLENELDIVNRKSNVPITTPFINQTPAKNKYQNKKIQERPMKEYMALKSRMSCLLTPNIKRFNPSESRNNIHCETDNAKVTVSNKLLAELYNLYEDSL